MKKKSGFTMVEIMLILMIISTALITIIMGVTRTTRYISEMRQRTIALNLAKEGIEAVYNIRDTNWRRRSANRDQCRLKANPMVDDTNDGCENDQWMTKKRRRTLGQGKENNMTSQYYFLKHRSSAGHSPHELQDANELKDQLPFFAKAENNPNDPHNHYLLHAVRGKWLSNDNFNGLSDEEKRGEDVSEGKFWRFITVDTNDGLGLFSKEDNAKLTCENGLTTNCGTTAPKEFRFCSTVLYTRPYQGVVNVCSIMTNFLE